MKPWPTRRVLLHKAGEVGVAAAGAAVRVNREGAEVGGREHSEVGEVVAPAQPGAEQRGDGPTEAMPCRGTVEDGGGGWHRDGQEAQMVNSNIQNS